MARLAICLLLSLASPAQSRTLRGRLAAADGSKTDFQDFVVWVEEGPSLPDLPSPDRAPAMNQLHKQFSPRILAIRAGEKVRFENLDNVFHDVFSPDQRNKFDLGLYKGKKHFQEDRRTRIGDGSPPLVEFPAPGKFAVYCDLHPDMSGTIYVFNHGYFAQSDKEGLFDLPVPDSGTVTLVVGGPRAAGPVENRIDIGSAPSSIDVPVRLRKVIPDVSHPRKDGTVYGRPD